jgi:2-phospho-L-lactate guanylyltransferase
VVCSPDYGDDAAFAAEVVRAAFASGGVARAIVVSADPEALEAATALDPRVDPLPQASTGLLPALDEAREAAVRLGAETVAILFGDLPLIDATDVRALLRPDASVAIAPDQRGAGTNALVLRGPALAQFAFQFGEGSRALHEDEARRIGASPVLVQSPGTMFDLDTPDDWRRIALAPEWSRLGALLEEATPR